MDMATYILCKSFAKKYTDQVTQSLMGGVHYRGSVNYYIDLPNNAQEGDSYTVKYADTSGNIADGTEYTWGYDTDLKDYTWISFSKDAYSKAETNALLATEQAKTTGMTEGGSDYITVNGIRVYFSTTQPTGARTGDLWIGG